ncbi:hypothetical protein I8752_24975 [Nostocaceae cyanobacterium CENA369]|uniref:Uncharacterized protein n=1 Tax=Dendronalium phyllosphericum CENA369 TaxID=1725256 RepID=A0A8J7IB26_9NOST|nr:hypothetical protein [Dendronalium phyllosphericum]MBH8576186.1 hypothetical protein [Dendronalium phyllosphericum CENA369]
MCDSGLTPHFLETVGRTALDTIRYGGRSPPFRLLCRVAIIRRLAVTKISSNFFSKS